MTSGSVRTRSFQGRQPTRTRRSRRRFSDIIESLCHDKVTEAFLSVLRRALCLCYTRQETAFRIPPPTKARSRSPRDTTPVRTSGHSRATIVTAPVLHRLTVAFGELHATVPVFRTAEYTGRRSTPHRGIGRQSVSSPNGEAPRTERKKPNGPVIPERSAFRIFAAGQDYQLST